MDRAACAVPFLPGEWLGLENQIQLLRNFQELLALANLVGTSLPTFRYCNLYDRVPYP